jgi:hypothetical protein
MQEPETEPTEIDRTASPRRDTLLKSVTLLILVAVHASLLAFSAMRNSVTVDEYAHLPAGLAYLKYGEWSIYNQSPPLLRMWAAWPALLAGANVPPATRFRDDPPADRHWNYADEYALLNHDRYHHLLVLSRLPMIALSCAGLLLVYAAATELYGRGGGLLAAALWALCPNVAAHGSIVGTDAGTAIFMLAAVWTWTRFCAAPSPPRCAVATAALSAVLLCKFSALLLIPVFVAIAAWAMLIDRRRRGAIGIGSVAAALGALVLVNLGYGHRGSFTPVGQYSFGSSLMQRAQSILPASTPLPLPRDFVRGFDEQKREADLGYPAYLLGEQYRGSRWAYYPVAVATKLPVGTLAIGAIALVTLLLPSTRPKWRSIETPFLLALLLFAGAFAMLVPINIGIRYLLPALPLAFVLCGRIAAFPPRILRPMPWAMAAIVLVENLSVAPRYLTFFNAIAGGPINGQSILNDSNVDWGQALIDLREWMRDHRVDRVQLAYFGRIDPQIYGIAYTPATQSSGERFVAVSSYFRAGLAYRMPTPGGGRSGFVAIPIAADLRRIQPVAIVGDVIWIYDRADVMRAMNSPVDVR